MDEPSDLLDHLQKLFTILGIIGGALWAYFHCCHGKTYRPRLEPVVAGTMIVTPGASVTDQDLLSAAEVLRGRKRPDCAGCLVEQATIEHHALEHR